jgi:hypothetical protein
MRTQWKNTRRTATQAVGGEMSCWNKEQLENMLEDIINELNLSNNMIEKHGPLGTSPLEC